MTIETYPTRVASLNYVSFSGAIAPSEFDKLLAFYASDGAAAARRDRLLVFQQDVELSAITSVVLASVAGRLRTVISQARMPMILRSALVCLAPAQRPVVEAWRAIVAGEPSLLTEIAIFDDIETAAVWIGLTRRETDDLKQATSDNAGTPIAING